MLTALLSSDYWGTDNQPPRSGARADAFCQMLSYGFQMKPEAADTSTIFENQGHKRHRSICIACIIQTMVLCKELRLICSSFLSWSSDTFWNNDVVYKYWFHPEGENPGTGTLTSTRGHNTGEVMWGGLPGAAWGCLGVTKPLFHLKTRAIYLFVARIRKMIILMHFVTCHAPVTKTDKIWLLI